ncbi:MAG: AraC family transcriptional regulator [Timaviella obliquedivisa GSE-PSE-MK23-08B]|jgi:AraC-like DNA-binding protein|nr:AraC family transcriptional regulator [Timaviella obliquedivisa GSE-PSE-MK23-08B]
MAIALSQSDYWALFQDVEEQNAFSDDKFDITWKYPEQLGQGYWREIRLRDGVELAIAHYQLHDTVTMQLPEREHPLEYSFHLAGGYKNQQSSARTGQYSLCGSGLAPVETSEWVNTEQIDVNVHIEQEIFTTWLNQTAESVPQELQHLIKSSSQIYYNRSGTTTGMMQTAVQQILHCPFQGITKRMYLESKVWELMALLVEEELKLRDNKKTISCAYPLKPDDVDRIHQAKIILMQRLDNPPSLMELARQVGLNDCTLKRGFRQVFDTTAFGLLHDYRLEQAQQLLEERQLNISEIAQAIGFANRSYFASAFRKKFGVTPREYLSSYKNSA